MKEITADSGNGGQRLATLLVYLNDVPGQPRARALSPSCELTFFCL